MENKNNTALFNIGYILLGLLVGWLIWGGFNYGNMMSGNNAHTVSNGSYVNNNKDISSVMTNMNAVLIGKTGEAFDKEFIEQMTIHHMGAIEMAKLALSNAGHQEIKDLAKNIISAQTNEINQMKVWKDSWFK